MLMLTRRSGQSIRLAPDPALDPATPVGEFFRDGPIQIHVGHVEGNRVHIGIEAHPTSSSCATSCPRRRPEFARAVAGNCHARFKPVSCALDGRMFPARGVSRERKHIRNRPAARNYGFCAR